MRVSKHAKSRSVRDAGRIAAAVEVLGQVETRHKTAKLALKAWGDVSRFAGAKDRAFVSGLVLDALRRRRSAAWRMAADTPRAAILGALVFDWNWPIERLAQACADGPHATGPLTSEEVARLSAPRSLDGASSPVRGDYPDWLDPHLARVFGEGRAEEGAALALRAPVDLRVNRLKAEREQVLAALEGFGAQPLGAHPDAIRIPAPLAAERAAPVEAHPAFLMGWCEVQDLASQLVAALAGDVREARVLDLCAGGGGKSLALAAAMGNTGKLYAYDSDPRRMVDLLPRAARAGVTNLEMRSPFDKDPLRGLEGGMDVVFVDAPCTGTGTWRRRPDAKWRLTAAQLSRRMTEQDAVLAQAAKLVRPGGRIVYATCSVLAEENEDRITAFLERQPGFAKAGDVLRTTPLRGEADGFFAAVITRA